MSPIWVGDAGGAPRLAADPWVADATGTKRQVQKAWVGDGGGVPRLVYNRAVPVELTATATAWNRIDLSWNAAATGATYVLKRNGTAIYTGTGTSKADTGLSASTTYNYSIEAKSGTVVLSADTASATTSARPTTTVQVTLDALASASYNGAGSNRGVSEMYGGRYSSTQGRQKSLAYFAVPNEAKAGGGGAGITKVEISFFTRHHYYSSGGRVRFAPHRNWTPFGPATWPGSGPTFGEYSADRGAWAGGQEWLDITTLVPSGWKHNMATEFYSQGAQGIAIVAPDDTYNFYGYWDGAGQTYRPRLRLTYKIYTA